MVLVAWKDEHTTYRSCVVGTARPCTRKSMFVARYSLIVADLKLLLPTQEEGVITLSICCRGLYYFTPAYCEGLVDSSV